MKHGLTSLILVLVIQCGLLVAVYWPGNTAEYTTPAPMVGFVAWQRNFAGLPAANYGRIVEHSRVQSSS